MSPSCQHWSITLHKMCTKKKNFENKDTCHWIELKWLLICRISSGQWPDLKAVYITYHNFTNCFFYLGRTKHSSIKINQLIMVVQQMMMKDTCSRSTSSFPITIWLGTIIFFFFRYHSFFFPMPTFLFWYFCNKSCQLFLIKYMCFIQSRWYPVYPPTYRGEYHRKSIKREKIFVRNVSLLSTLLPLEI